MPKSRKRAEQLARKRSQRSARMKGGGTSAYAQKCGQGQMYGIQRGRAV